ncbi:MAG TPA: C4-type zinc ribbon domain-containing protein [Chitinivibrionales bacterium]|nr:C4-type zinc ribbon domain-containing protein [Chitinivibrionales bacterium]
MIKDLESLIHLQAIDLQIHEILQSQRDLPKLLSELEKAVVSAQKTVDGVSQQLAANATEKKTFEEKVGTAKSALEKSQERLSSIKTNREYDAVHAEIENFKSIIAGADARMKSLSAETDKLQQSLEAHKAEREKIKGENDPKIAELKTKIASIDSSVAQLKEGRGAIIAGIPKPLLRTYEHILSRRKNAKVLSFVDDSHRTCSSCFKVLETQLVNEIRKGARLLTCQNCGAIFVWGEKPVDKVTDKSEEKKEEAPAA